MKLKKNKIGLKMGSKIGFITIEEDESKFELYKKLGLDVFTSSKKSNSKPELDVHTDGENDNK